MVRKKVDDRVRTLIENGVKTHHRSLLVLVGDHGKDQSIQVYFLSKPTTCEQHSLNGHAVSSCGLRYPRT